MCACASCVTEESNPTCHLIFVFLARIDPSNPSNVWACLRTIEAFGIQNVHVIIQSDAYRGKAALSQKRGLRTAVGSAQWLTLRTHASATAALHAIRATEPDCRFYAADLHPTAVDIRTIAWDSTNENETSENDSTDRPICIVMGNEESGISDEMRRQMNVLFTLPMVGFAESFNLSVATAITLAHLSAASTATGPGPTHTGPLRPGDLTQHERQCLLLKGLLNSLPQKRMAQAMLRQAGIDLPPELAV
jgi:tRNA G18 (ribose-2'-O)-methylase SpoU